MTSPEGTIRLATPADAPQIRAIYAPFVSDTTISFELEAPTEATMRERIAGTLRTHPWLVFEGAGRVAGYAYASPHRERLAYQWGVDVACYVHPDMKRRGIGRALYRALFGLLREQGFCNAYAGIALPNAGSVGLHESVGFTPVGIYRGVGYKLGGWRDVGWWECRLRELPAEPPPPQPLPALLARRPGILDQLGGA